jgi:PilZ domain
MVQPVSLRHPAQAGEPDQAWSVGRRGAARLRLAIPVRLVSTRATESCVLLDLSRTGARIGLAEPLPPGSLLYLNVAGLELFAEVVRRDLGKGGGTNGLAFDEPLPDEAVIAVRHFAETFEQRERKAIRDSVRRWVDGQTRI